MSDTLLHHAPARPATGRTMRALVALGTRPEHLKLAPVTAALRRRGVQVDVLHTGQQTDSAMVGAGLSGSAMPATEQWELPRSDAERVGVLLQRSYERFSRPVDRPDVLIVQGDTNTAALVAMGARRHGVPVAHVEAGLRSGNERSQEEINRRLLATLATVHLAPTAVSAGNLAGEAVPLDRIHVVGNPICDTLAATGVDRVAPRDRQGVLVTAHRATNVDDPRRLAELVALLRGLALLGEPVCLPLHPRTRDRLEAHHLLAELDVPDLELVEPLPHEQLLHRLASARVVVTDSGGLQEEASWFGIPVVVLRTSTPRPEGVEQGQAVLTGLDPRRVVEEVERLAAPAAQRRIWELHCPYGDGHSGERIAAVLVERHAAGRLRVDEPAFAGGRA